MTDSPKEEFEVLKTAREVAEEGLHVRIDRDALARLARSLAKRPHVFPAWDNAYHYCGGEEETATYMLVLDTLNFCFWPADGKRRWEIRYGNEDLSGYFGLAAALKRAVEAGAPILQADCLSSLTMAELEEVLAGEGELQLMERRLEGLRELGEVLAREYRGRASGLIRSAEGSAVRLARLLAEKLSSFRDVTEYRGRKVFFYKRAQIVAADLYGAFGGKGPGSFLDMNELTAFADYKLPQVLRHVGTIRYSSLLEEKVDQKLCLEPGSPEEVEIRANTIWAVELIRRELERAGRTLMAYEIDGVLWNMGQDDRFREKPYHRTVTIYY